MIVTIGEPLDGVTTLQLDFSDEGVALSGQTHVLGDASTASTYVSVFETDLRRNYRRLFPVEETVSEEMME